MFKKDLHFIKQFFNIAQQTFNLGSGVGFSNPHDCHLVFLNHVCKFVDTYAVEKWGLCHLFNLCWLKWHTYNHLSTKRDSILLQKQAQATSWFQATITLGLLQHNVRNLLPWNQCAVWGISSLERVSTEIPPDRASEVPIDGECEPPCTWVKSFLFEACLDSWGHPALKLLQWRPWILWSSLKSWPSEFD